MDARNTFSSNGKRGCIFCGGSPLTKEHIWSDWLDSILPRGSSHRSEARETTVVDAVVEGLPVYRPIQKHERVREGAVHSTKTRTVCKRCNGGWMKEIVDRAKAVAERVIRLQAHVLSPDDQVRLATWLALSAVMRDQKAIAHPQKIQSDVLHHLSSRSLPPPDVFVAVGAFLGPKSVADSYNVRVAREIDAPHKIVSSMHSVAVSMGGLFAVMIVPWRVAPGLLEQLPALYADSLTQIWPPQDRDIPWPNYARAVIRGAFEVDDPGNAFPLSLRARAAYKASFQGRMILPNTLPRGKRNFDY